MCRGHDPFQSIAQFVWFKAKRAGLALIDNATAPVDKVDPVRPSGVGPLHRVVKSIDQGRKFYAQFANACAGNVFAFFKISRAGKYDLILDIALHLPDVAGVRFQDVDGIELNAILVLIVELVESGNLPPEGRSSVAAEHEHHRLLRDEGGELDRAGFVLLR